MSNTTDFQQAVASERTKLATREIKHTREQALMGDVTGVLTGPSGVPWILARLGGDPSRRVEAYNGTSLVPTFNMSVTLIVRYEDGRATHYEVERLSNDIAYANYVPSDTGGYAPHRWAHEYRPDGTGGWDAVLVYPRANTILRLTANNPPDLSLYVFPGWYGLNGTMYYFAGGPVGPFTPPGAGIEYQTVFIDAAGNFTINSGAGITIGSPTYAVTFPGLCPIGAVQLTFGQTAIVEDDLVQDIRPFINWNDGSTVPGPVAFTSILTPSVIAADQNNYSPAGLASAATLRLASSSDVNITGLATGTDGRVLFVHNVGAFNITLVSESASSSGANRFALTDTTITLLPNALAMFQYDATSLRWRVDKDAAGVTSDVLADSDGDTIVDSDGDVIVT